MLFNRKANKNIIYKKKIYFFAIVSMLLIYSFVVTFDPIQSTIAFIFFIVFIVATQFSEYIFIIAILLIAISPANLFPVRIFDFITIESLHKLMILIGISFIILKNGIKRNITYMPIVIYVIVTVMSILFSTKLINFKYSDLVTTFFGYILGWIIFYAKFKNKNFYLKMISFLPIYSIISGTLLNLVGLRNLIKYEVSTGTIRLQGADIAPSLAMLGIIGMLSATTLYYITDEKRKYFYLITMIINLFIVIGTITRIQIIGAIIIVVSFVFKYLKEQLKQNKSIGLKVICISVICVIMCGLLGTQVTKRNNAIHENIGINTSGRIEAWKVYWDISSINRKFGLGLGSVKEIQYKQYNNLSLKYFTVPHNEYLKFIIELGIIGFILIILSFILVFRKLLKHNILGDWKFLIQVSIIVFVIASFTDNTISAKCYWIPFCLYLGLIYDENGVNTIKEDGGVTND